MNDVGEKWLKGMKQQYPELLKKIFYVDTGEGWYPLLEHLFEEVTRREKILEESGNKFVEDIAVLPFDGPESENTHSRTYFVQIKEKFGGLRAYYEGCSDTGIYNLINEAESKSFTVCEECSVESTTKQRNVRGWIHTFCDSCNDAYVQRKTK